MTGSTHPEDDDGFAKALFVASSAERDIRDVLSEADAMKDKPVSFADIAECLSNPGSEVARRVTELSATRPDVGAAVAALASRIAIDHMPAVAAASDGALSVRETDSFRLRLETPYERDDFIYLIVERLDDGREMPRLVIGIPDTGNPVMQALPESDESGIQLMLPTGSPFLHLFRDPDSRFLLA